MKCAATSMLETLVFLPIVCARQVLDQLQMSATAVVWVHWADHGDLDWLGRHFFDLDDPGPNLGKRSRLKAECQTYVDIRHQPKRSADVIYLNAKRSADVIYLNAPRERRS